MKKILEVLGECWFCDEHYNLCKGLIIAVLTEEHAVREAGECAPPMYSVRTTKKYIVYVTEIYEQDRVILPKEMRWVLAYAYELFCTREQLCSATGAVPCIDLERRSEYGEYRSY